MIRKILPALFLAVLVTGCSQETSSDEIAKFVYKWEKARFDRDYDAQQKLLYKQGSYEVNKTAKKVNSRLKYEYIRYEVYFDSDTKKYYVLANFKNPNGSNTVNDNLVIRENKDQLKVDIDEGLKVEREQIKKEFPREACIHCK